MTSNGNLHEATNDELQDAATIAERDGDTRSHQALLAELKRRQETLTRRAEMETIRRVAAQYAPPVPITGTPLVTDAETGKKYGC